MGTTQGSVSGHYLFNIFLNDPRGGNFRGSLLWELYVSNQCDPSANPVGQFMTDGLRRTCLATRKNVTQYNPVFDECS